MQLKKKAPGEAEAPTDLTGNRGNSSLLDKGQHVWNTRHILELGLGGWLNVLVLELKEAGTSVHTHTHTIS